MQTQDEMPHYMAFHLGLHCLPKYQFTGIRNEKQLIYSYLFLDRCWVCGSSDGGLVEYILYSDIGLGCVLLVFVLHQSVAMEIL